MPTGRPARLTFCPVLTDNSLVAWATSTFTRLGTTITTMAMTTRTRSAPTQIDAI